MSATVIGQFKGHPTITFEFVNGRGQPDKLTMGVLKAKTILENLDALKNFVSSNDKEPTETVNPADVV